MEGWKCALLCLGLGGGCLCVCRGMWNVLQTYSLCEHEKTNHLERRSWFRRRGGGGSYFRPCAYNVFIWVSVRKVEVLRKLIQCREQSAFVLSVRRVGTVMSEKL